MRAVCRRQNVVRGHHQNARFKLSLKAQRDVNGHLVAVKVRVERRTHERVKLQTPECQDGAASAHGSA